MRKIDTVAEAAYENRKASGEDIRQAQSKFYWATELMIHEHKNKTIKAIKDKHILEVGCSSGVDAREYIRHSKFYTGIDISDVAIDNCFKLNLNNSIFLCVDGHNIPVEDSSQDCVIVSSLLHHLDLEKSLPEIHRVLKEDGVLIFREPLGTNPLFQLYRWLTPYARTDDERPFTFNDISLMKKYFILEDLSWFGFLNLLSAFARFELARVFLTEIDKLLSKSFIKYFYWQFSGISKKIDKPRI